MNMVIPLRDAIIWHSRGVRRHPTTSSRALRLCRIQILFYYCTFEIRKLRYEESLENKS